MLKIEFDHRIQEYEDIPAQEIDIIIVDGIVDEDSFVHFEPTTAHLYNEDAINALMSYSFLEVQKYLSEFSIDKNVEWWSPGLEFEFIVGKYFDEPFPSIKVTLLFSFGNWGESWSFLDMCDTFQEMVESSVDKSFTFFTVDDPEPSSNGFGIVYRPDDLNLNIKLEFEKAISIVKSLVDSSTQSLAAKLDSKSLFTYYTFPEEIRNACEQYLIYFTQFIADLGIDVSAEIKEEASRTLFKVTPIDQNQALDQIREALELYLNAPDESQFHNNVSNNNDVAAQQWDANVYHLKGQLSLAKGMIQLQQAAIEMKDATIQTKDETIRYLQLSTYQLKPSIDVKKEDNELQILDGLASVKKYEGKGFAIDLPEIVRRLQRKFKKKKDS